MDTRELVSLGQTIGISGDMLRKWIDAERAPKGFEMLAEREAAKEELDAERRSSWTRTQRPCSEAADSPSKAPAGKGSAKKSGSGDI